MLGLTNPLRRLNHPERSGALVLAVYDHVEPDIEYTRSSCSRRKTEFRLPEAYGKSSDALLNQVTQTKHRMNDCSIFLPEERADTYRQQGEKVDRQYYLFCPFSWAYLLIMYEPTNSCRIHGPPRKRVQHQRLAPLFFQQCLAGKEGKHSSTYERVTGK